MADGITEQEYWIVAHEKQRDARLWTLKDAQNYCTNLINLNDPDWVPTKITHIVEHTTITTSDVPLPGVTAEKIVAVLSEDLVKLGGMVPQGMDAIEWAVRRVLAVQKELKA